MSKYIKSYTELSGGGGLEGMARRLEAIARSSRPGRPRRYFLTFRGSMYYPSGAERRELLLPLARAVFADHDRFVNASARAGATRVSYQSLH